MFEEEACPVIRPEGGRPVWLGPAVNFLRTSLLIRMDLPHCAGAQPRSNRDKLSPNHSHRVQSMKLSKMSRYDEAGIMGPNFAPGELLHTKTPYSFRL